MNLSFPAHTATLLALRRASEPHVVMPALSDPRFARVLALAPDVDPIVGALGALAGGLPDILPPHVLGSPALSAAMQSLIGTEAGVAILESLAEVAPVGWGASHTDALINAVRVGRCPRWAAAALIGPCDASAAMLTWSDAIARAVRCWGMATPNHPTAWTNDLPSSERDRLLDALRAHPDDAAFCMPWLPTECAGDIVGRVCKEWVATTLDAYIAASPVARTHHAAILSNLIQCANPDDLSTLARLAVATGMDAAWAEIVRLLSANRWSAELVVAAAPWSDLPIDVQRVILAERHQSNACAAIAFARGAHPDPPPIMGTTACAFFAAVTPEVWSALPAEMQQTWHRYLAVQDAHLAVRSLGPDPAFLAGADLDAALIAAMRRHTSNDESMRWTIHPIAVRDLPITAVPDIVAALPKPSDPIAFVQIACGEREISPALRDWIAAHPSPHALGAVTAVMRTAARFDCDLPSVRCAALAHALEGQSPAETNALLAALPKDTHLTLLSDRDALADALTPPDRRDAFRQTLDAIIALPPSVAISARHALATLSAAQRFFEQRDAGAGLATALRNHGRIFADITKALDDAARSAVLPRLSHPHDESALETLVAADPLVAHHVAHALRDNNPSAARTALATAPPQEARRLWHILPDTFQHAILGDLDTLAANAAAEGQADALVQILRDWVGKDDPRPILALHMLRSGDEEWRERGIALFAQDPDAGAALLPLLREDLRTTLTSDPVIAFASADLPPMQTNAFVRTRRRRRSL